MKICKQNNRRTKKLNKMRTTIIFFTVLLSATFVSAEGLNSRASYIKKNYPTEYEQTLKKYALAEWKDDFSMVVHEINSQADALVKFSDDFVIDIAVAALAAAFVIDEDDGADEYDDFIDDYTDNIIKIAVKAIQKWSRDGYKSKNITLFKEMTTSKNITLIKEGTTWELYDLVKLHCDWPMVKYEYDKQVKAKNSF